MRHRQAALLVPAVLRALPRAQLAVGLGAAAVFVWLLCIRGDGAHAITGLQYAALASSLALASILDEPDRVTVAAVPPPLRFRRGLVVAVVAPATVAAWAVLVALSGVDAQPARAVTLQLAALVAVTLALAAVLARGGALAGAVVVLAFLGADGFAPQWALTPDLGEPRWAALWIGLAVGGLLALLLVSRDPASDGPLRGARRRRATAVAERA